MASVHRCKSGNGSSPGLTDGRAPLTYREPLLHRDSQRLLVSCSRSGPGSAQD